MREFATFRVDLAAPVADVPAERLEALPPLLGIEQVDAAPPVRVMAWTWQIADKACAMFETREGGHSSRARDLADISMISLQIGGIDGDELIAAIRSQEAGRKTGALPDGLPTGSP